MSFTYAGTYNPTAFTDVNGKPLPNIAITIYLHGTQNLATLYTDRTKAVHAANPLTTDSKGNLEFYADPGQYDIVGDGATLGPVSLPVDSAEPAGSVAGALLAANNLSDLNSVPTARTNLGLAAGATAAIDTTAADFLSDTSGGAAGSTGKLADAGHRHPPSNAYLQPTNNLTDVGDKGTTKYNLEIAVDADVAAVSIGNINIASPGAVFDGYTMQSNDQLLLVGQSTPSQNGIWIWNGPITALVRPTEFPSGGVIKRGRLVKVDNGTLNAQTLWSLAATTTGLTIDTNNQVWTAIVNTLAWQAAAQSAAYQATPRRGGNLNPSIPFGQTFIQTVTGATNVGTTVTLTVPGGYTLGQLVNVAGFAATNGWNNANGWWTVTAIGAGTITFVVSVAPTGAVGAMGTVTNTYPVYDVVIGDSIAYGQGSGAGGAGIGFTDHFSVLTNMENRYNGLPDEGRGFKRPFSFGFSTDTWNNLAQGSTAPVSLVPAGNCSYQITTVGNIIGDTRVFRRAVVFIRKVVNGLGVQVSFNGGSTFTSTFDSNGSSGYLLIDSGDLGSIASRTIQVKAMTQVTGSGAGNLQVDCYVAYQSDGTNGLHQINLAQGGTSTGDWVNSRVWDQQFLPALPTPPRRAYIMLGINDIGLVTATAGTNVGTSVTLTTGGGTTTPHSNYVGQQVVVSGATGGTWSNINGTWTITAVGAGTITFVVNVAPTGSYTASSATAYVTPASMAAGITTIVQRIQAACPLTEVVLCPSYQLGSASVLNNPLTTPPAWAGFVNAIQGVANALNCTFVDTSQWIGSVQNANIGGTGDVYGVTDGDNVHLGDASISTSGRDGQAALAELYWSRLSYRHLPPAAPAPGWTADTNVWTETVAGSGSAGWQFTAVGNKTSFYTKGRKVHWADSGSVKYGVIATSAYSSTTNLTTVTGIPTSDYTMAAGSVSPDLGTNWISDGMPPGFPTTFGFTPTFTGCTGGVVGGNWAVNNGLCTVNILSVVASTGSATTFTVSNLPINAAGANFSVGRAQDAGTEVLTVASTASSSAVLTLSKSVFGGAWTASGNREALVQITYSI